METQVVMRTLVVVQCGVCDILFGLSQAKYDRCFNTGEGFFCPNGHNFYSQPENARLRRELEQAKRIRTNLEGDVAWEQREKGRIGAQLRATKGVVTKIRRRVANGVCPCCKRHFVNLKRHMSGQHPEFAGTTESEQSRPQATKPKS